MNLLKLNTILVSAVALLGSQVALADSHAAAPKVAPVKAVMAASLKRSVLLSGGQAEPSLSDVEGNLESSGYSNASATETDSANTFGIGYRQPLNARWSIDASYIDTGGVTASVEAAPSGSSNTAEDVAKSLPIYGSGLNYVALRHMPISRQISAMAGGGLFLWTNEREATIDGVKHVEKDNGLNAMAQLGLSFVVTPRVSFEINAQHFLMPGDDVQRVSLGVAVGF